MNRLVPFTAHAFPALVATAGESISRSRPAPHGSDRVAYASAMTSGNTAPELWPKGPTAGEIDALWNELKSCLWDLTSGAESALRAVYMPDAAWANCYRVNALCALPDGRLASGSDDQTIRLWDVISGAEAARLEADAPIACLTALPYGP